MPISGCRNKSGLALPRTSISSAIPLTSMVDLPSARAISSLPPLVPGAILAKQRAESTTCPRRTAAATAPQSQRRFASLALDEFAHQPAHLHAAPIGVDAHVGCGGI